MVLAAPFAAIAKPVPPNLHDTLHKNYGNSPAIRLRKLPLDDKTIWPKISNPARLLADSFSLHALRDKLWHPTEFFLHI